MPTRRHFVAHTIQGASLIALTHTVPMFVPATLAAAGDKDSDRVLVVVELDGGNDGINTVVPFQDEGYRRHRRVLRLPKERLLRLNDELALHPSMRALADLWEDDGLAIVQGVGYPNPNRSHFRSMEVWHSGVVDAGRNFGLGWIGKAFDGVPAARSQALCMSVGRHAVPLALRGKRTNASSIQRVEQYDVPDGRLDFLHRVAGPVAAVETGGNALDFVRRAQATALQTAKSIRSTRPRHGGERYPATAFGRQLSLTAQLLRSGMKSRVFYTQQSGYDTHSGQLTAHAGLLREFSDSLAAFLRDVQSAGLADRVLVLAFSEFGRRVRENGTEGTDHGTAGPVFLAGKPVAAGIHGSTPRLTELVNGDLKMSLDFRRVYATILGDWLGLPVAERRFEKLRLFKGV